MGKACFENIKTKQGSAGRLISWDIYFLRFRFAVGFTHNHLNGVNQQGGNMTWARWLAIRLSIRHIYSPSTATEEHTELSLLPRDRKTRSRKEREGPLDSRACFSNWSKERLHYCISLHLGWKQATIDFFSLLFFCFFGPAAHQMPPF